MPVRLIKAVDRDLIWYMEAESLPGGYYRTSTKCKDLVLLYWCDKDGNHPDGQVPKGFPTVDGDHAAPWRHHGVEWTQGLPITQMAPASPQETCNRNEA